MNALQNLSENELLCFNYANSLTTRHTAQKVTERAVKCGRILDTFLRRLAFWGQVNTVVVDDPDAIENALIDGSMIVSVFAVFTQKITDVSTYPCFLTGVIRHTQGDARYEVYKVRVVALSYVEAIESLANFIRETPLTLVQKDQENFRWR